MDLIQFAHTGIDAAPIVCHCYGLLRIGHRFVGQIENLVDIVIDGFSRANDVDRMVTRYCREPGGRHSGADREGLRLLPDLDIDFLKRLFASPLSFRIRRQIAKSFGLVTR